MSDRTGQQLGHYRLVRLLGRGGFAEVYLGEHLRLKTQAAIKVLYTALEEDDIEGFLREAQTVARLKHPHIVRVFDFDVQDHTPYLVMDYLPNGSIRRLYPKGAVLPLTAIVSSVRQIASALQYAHDQKVIHRDIKPENMLLDQDNSLVLSDFGIALMAQSSRYQSVQEVAGTAAYMAPEQFQGHPQRASDQYALGVVVYEWLSGDRPFHGTFSEIASQHLFVPPPPLSQKVPTISSDLEQVVRTILEKDPRKRFDSVRDFSTALERACQLASSHSATLHAETPKRNQKLPTTKTGGEPLPSQSLPPTVTAKPFSSPVTRVTKSQSNSQEKNGTSNIGKNEQSHFIPNSASHVTTSKNRGNNRTVGISFLIIILALLLVGGSMLTIPSLLKNSHTSGPTAPIVQAGDITATAQANATNTADAAFMSSVYANGTATAQAKAAKRFAVPSSWHLILDDPLTDNSRGYQWDDNGSSCQFTNGAYHVTPSITSPFNCTARATHFADFAYQIQMKGSGGVTFHAHTVTYYNGSVTELFYFDISQDGSYIFGWYLDPYGGGSRLFSGSDPAIKTGVNQSNTLEVIVINGMAEIYVNQSFLDSENIGTDRGPVGVEGTAIFSNAKVWVP